MNFSNIKIGDVLSSTMYMHVAGKDSNSIDVKDTAGRLFTVKGPKLIESTMASATQFDTEEKVSQTRAAEILTGAGDTVFCVEYIKQDGKERTLVGHLTTTENLMGRSNVVDLMITTGNPLRLADHRTIKSIILKGTKYTVKK